MYGHLVWPYGYLCVRWPTLGRNLPHKVRFQPNFNRTAPYNSGNLNIFIFDAQICINKPRRIHNSVVECGIADPEVTGSIPVGCFFASLPSLDILEHPQLPNFLFACMIWPRQCSRVWHADHHRCCGADTNVEISDVYDPRVSAQAPPGVYWFFHEDDIIISLSFGNCLQLGPFKACFDAAVVEL